MKNSAEDPPSHKATANRAPDYSRRLSKDLKLTRFPNSLAATLRGFTFYLADPTRSLGCSARCLGNSCAEDSARYSWRLIQTPYSFTL